MPAAPPRSLATPRLRLRRLEPADAGDLKAAIDSSLDHVRPWVPWSFDHPMALEQVREYLAGSVADWEAGRAFRWAILDAATGEHLGGVSLHPRVGPGAIEAGYWLRHSATGKGFATEAARAAVDAAFGLPGLQRVEMKVDVENATSIAVPRRLGFTLHATEPEALHGRMRRLHVFTVTAEAWRTAGGG
ncbi:MAG: GNAT family N-acetyltransferase [Anaeromyxobacteraceae bacterium]